MQFWRKAGRRLVCLAMMALLLAALLPNAALAAKAEASATTMRVAGTEGTVTVKNGSGQSKSVFNNMQLYNSWTVETAAASYATLSLDSAKAIKLGASTKVELRQNTASKKLELFVTKGSLFFDVSDKLAEDETMNIRTTNMVCGVRGTMGEVEAVSSTCTVTYLLAGSTAVINTNDCFSPLTDGGAFGGASGEAAPAATGTVSTDGETGTATATGYFTNLLASLGGAATPSGETTPAVDPTTLLTVRSGDGRTTVFVENTLREVVVNGVTVPSGSKTNTTVAGTAPKVTPMTPGDRAVLGASLAARNGAQPASGGGAASPAGTPLTPAAPEETQFAYTTVTKLQTGDLSGVALEHLSRETASALRAIEAIRANGGDAEVVSFIENLTPEVAAQVKAREERAAAAAAAESEGTNAVYQKNQTAKAERNGVEDKVTNTWGVVTGDVGSQAASQGTATRYQGAVLVEKCEHGTVKTNVDQKAYEGDTVTLTVTPDPGYVLEELYYDNAGHPGSLYMQIPPKNGVYSFTMPRHGVKIYATFVLPGQLYVSILPMLDQHGKLEADKTGMVRAGQTVTVTATPDAHYTVETVYYRYTYNVYNDSGEITGTEKDAVILTPVDGVYRFTVPNAKSLEIGATFRELTTHPVAIDSDIQHGTVRADKTGMVYEGDTVTLTVTPDDGYVIDSVYYDYEGGSFDIVPVNGVYSFVVPDVPALRIHATFKEGTEYRIFLPDAEHGRVWATSYGGSNVKKAAEGDYVSVNFLGDIVDQGRHYSASGVTATWGADDTPVDFMMTVRGGDPDTGAVSDGYIFMMPASDVTFTGEFVPCYAIEINTSEGGSAAVSKVGSLSMSAERAPYAASGETVLLTVEPEEGYSLTVTDADGKAVTVTEDSFTMPASAVTVGFQSNETPAAEYDLKTASLTNGSISFTVGGQTVTKAAEGATVTMIVTPDEGYVASTYSCAKADGSPVQLAATDDGLIFTMPGEAVTASAVFTQEEPPAAEYDLTVAEGVTNGSIRFTVDGETVTKAAEGATVTLIAEPDEGFVVEFAKCAKVGGSAIDLTPGEDGVWTFTMPDGAAVASAVFTTGAAPTITLASDLAASAEEHGFTVAYLDGDGEALDPTEVAEGESVSVVFTGSEGSETLYGSSGITVSGVSSGVTRSRTVDTQTGAVTDTIGFTMPGNGVVLSGGSFAQLYKAECAASNPGSIWIAMAGGFAYTDKPTVAYCAAGGKVYLAVNGGESYKLVQDSIRVKYGEGYAQELQVAGGEYTPSKFFEMPASDASVSGQFAQAVRILYSINGYGGIRGSIGDEIATVAKAFPGEVVTLTAVPDAGYATRVVKVSYGTNGSQSLPVNPTDDPNVWTFTAPDLETATQVSARAEFAEPQTIALASTVQHGDVSVWRQPYGVTTVTEVTDLENTNFFQGDTITLKFTPDDGYRLQTGTNLEDNPYYLEAGSSSINEITQQQDGTWTFQMPGADVTVKAVFEQAFTISTPSLSNGTVEVYELESENEWKKLEDETIVAAEGAEIKVVFTGSYDAAAETYYGSKNVSASNANNFTFKEREVENESGIVDTYTFVMPAEDVTVQADGFVPCYALNTMEFSADDGEVTITADGLSWTKNAASDMNQFYIAEDVQVTMTCTGKSDDGAMYCATGISVLPSTADSSAACPGVRYAPDAKGDIVSTYSFEMPGEDASLLGSFSQCYEITCTDSAHSTVTLIGIMAFDELEQPFKTVSFSGTRAFAAGEECVGVEVVVENGYAPVDGSFVVADTNGQAIYASNPELEGPDANHHYTGKFYMPGQAVSVSVPTQPEV